MTMKKLNNESRFSFSCTNCGTCCEKMEIQLSSLDIYRLSSHLQLSSRDFVGKYVLFLEDKKGNLKRPVFKDVLKGPCIFRVDSKCSIHGDRPLNCRFFPLMRKDQEYYLGADEFCPGKEIDTLNTLESYLDTSGISELISSQNKYIEYITNINNLINLELLKSEENYGYVLQIIEYVLYDFHNISLSLSVESGVENLGILSLSPLELFNFSLEMAMDLATTYLRENVNDREIDIMFDYIIEEIEKRNHAKA